MQHHLMLNNGHLHWQRVFNERTGFLCCSLPSKSQRSPFTHDFAHAVP